MLKDFFSPWTLNVWQLGLFKVTTIAFGILVGAYFHEFFSGWLQALFVIFLAGWLYFAIIKFKDVCGKKTETNSSN